MRILLAALAFAAPAYADYMGGLWPPGTLPPQPATTLVRIAPSSNGDPPALAANLYALTVVPQSPRYWEWNGIFAVRSYADYGEHVALYAKAHRYGNGPLFGAVIELNDRGGPGPSWALEVDAMVPTPTPSGPRTGIGIVVGRSRESVYRDPTDTARGRLDYGIRLLPNYYDGPYVDVDYGLKIDIPCASACISIPPNTWVTLDGGGSVGYTFNDRDGWLHFGIKGKEPALSIQMETGEIRSRGRVIAGSAGGQWAH